ncbi:Derlin 1 [Chytridiales sp. JEL 0842]|nr:Derlin 1 [Chytridiales sp. JEL 0842]
MSAPPPAPPQERGPLDELSDWFKSIPPITRALFAGSLGVSVAAGMGIVSPANLYLAWDPIVKKYQPISLALSQPLLLECIILSLLYIWAMHNKENEVTFFYGVRFKALYLPWVVVAFDFLTGAPFPPMGKLIGIAVGHLYYFLTSIYPEQNGGQKLLETPQFFAQFFPEDHPQPRGYTTGAAPQSGTSRLYRAGRPAAGATPGGQAVNDGVRQRYTWGSGNRLGSD